MLTTLRQILPHARQNGYAVGAFNVSNTMYAQTIISMAEEMSSPVIIQTTEKSLEFAGIRELASMLRVLCDQAKVPVVLHLDHGKDPDLAKTLVGYGYTSIMMDFSDLPFDRNLAITKDMAKFMHQKNLSIEGEVGAIAGKEDYVQHSQIEYTDPDQALEYVQATGIDALAIAFGNAHGEPQPGEKLNFEVLKRVRDKVRVPLVFHGASNTPPEDMTTAIALGMIKINIDTEIKHASTDAIRQFLGLHPEASDPREYFGAAEKAISELIKEKITLFKSFGHA